MKIRFFLSSIMMLTVFMILASAQPLGSRKPVTVNNMVTLEARNLPANGMEYDRILPDGTRVDWTTNFPKRKILIITDVEGIIKGALPPIAAQTLFELELVNPGVIPPGDSTVFKIDLTRRLVDGSTATLSNFLGGFQERLNTGIPWPSGADLRFSLLFIGIPGGPSLQSLILRGYLVDEP